MSETGVTTLRVNDVPASNNAGGGGARSNPHAAAREKKSWEGQYLVLCMAGKLPKGLTKIRANVRLEFHDPKRRRDVENYRQSVVKPLADALVKGGYLPDDTAEFFEVGAFEISPDKIIRASPLVKRGMTIELHWEK